MVSHQTETQYPGLVLKMTECHVIHSHDELLTIPEDHSLFQPLAAYMIILSIHIPFIKMFNFVSMTFSMQRKYIPESDARLF